MQKLVKLLFAMLQNTKREINAFNIFYLQKLHKYVQCSVIISFLIFLLQMAGSNSTSTREKLLGLVDDIELITKEIFENAIAPKVIKVKKNILEDSLDSIPSPSPSVKIQI